MTAAGTNSKNTTSNVSKATVIKIKMNSNEDEKVLMEYLLGKSDNTSPVLELISDKQQSPPPTTTSPTMSTVSSIPAARAVSPFSEDSIVNTAQSGGEMLNKNALNARLNRLKKKKYVEELEDSVKKLTSENVHLKCEADTLSAKVGALETELKYLKGVLANQSELSSLLANIGNTPGVTFHSTLAAENFDISPQKENMQRKRKLDDSDTSEGCVTRAMKAAKHGDNKASTSSKDICDSQCKNSETVPSNNIDLPSKSEAAGVCLHVSNGSVSIEFCSRCNNIANEAKKDDMNGRQK
ncbi:uncharacterized protein LOC144452025 [Glandiceps talaboti]